MTARVPDIVDRWRTEHIDSVKLLRDELSLELAMDSSERSEFQRQTDEILDRLHRRLSLIIGPDTPLSEPLYQAINGLVSATAGFHDQIYSFLNTVPDGDSTAAYPIEDAAVRARITSMEGSFRAIRQLLQSPNPDTHEE